MTKGIIATDVDGVLLDIYGPAFDYLEKKTGFRFTHEDITCWNWLTDVFGLSEGEQKAVWNLVWESPASPFTGAIEFVRTLRAKGYNVIGISTRPHGFAALAAARDFHTLGLDGYRLVQQHKHKRDHINNMKDVRLFIDDKVSNVVDIAVWCDVPTVLFRRPWNKGYKNPLCRGMIVDRYSDILGIV